VNSNFVTVIPKYLNSVTWEVFFSLYTDSVWHSEDGIWACTLQDGGRSQICDVFQAENPYTTIQYRKVHKRHVMQLGFFFLTLFNDA